MKNVVKLAIVGTGWRSGFYIRLAQLQPEIFEIVGIVARSEAARRSMEEKYKVRTFSSTDQLLRSERPDYVVVAVSWDANPTLVSELVTAGIPVLCETPPAPDATSLRNLWNEIGSQDLVQVAEQYLYLPGHAARLAAIGKGLIGLPTSVEVSSTHGYHAVSMMRGFMGVGYEFATVTARVFEAPLVDPLHRDSWNSDLTAVPKKTVVGLIDFGDGKSGIYNFVDNQWHNQLRHRRIVIRGSHGEIVDDKLVRLANNPAIVTSSFERYQLGYDLNLDGFDTQHISLDGEVLFTNPFVGRRLMDEEVAINQMMHEMAEWVAGDGPAPYPLRSACQDHLISLAIDEAIASGGSISTERESWAD